MGKRATLFIGRTVRLELVENEKRKREVAIVSDSVAALVFNKTKEEVLFVTQDREPMIDDNHPAGTITEVPAGRFDRDVSTQGLIKAELEEELGVKVDEKDIVLLNSEIPLATSPGILTERQYFGYVEIENHQINPAKRTYGLKKDGEETTRRFVPVSELPDMVFDDMKTWALVQWFLRKQGL